MAQIQILKEETFEVARQYLGASNTQPIAAAWRLRAVLLRVQPQ